MAQQSDNSVPQKDTPPSPLESLAHSLRQEYIAAKNPSSDPSSGQDDVAHQSDGLLYKARLRHALAQGEDALEDLQASVDYIAESNFVDSEEDTVSGELFHVPFYTPAVTVQQALACGVERTVQHIGTYALWLSPLIAFKLAFNGSLFTRDSSPESNLLIGMGMILLTIGGFAGGLRSSLKQFMRDEDNLARFYPSWFDATKQIASYYSSYLLLALLLYSTAGLVRAAAVPSVLGAGLVLKLAFTLPLAYILATYGQIIPSIMLNRKASLRIATEQTRDSYLSLMKAILWTQGAFLIISSGLIWISFRLAPHLSLFKTLLQGTAGVISVVGMLITLNIVFAYFFTAGHHLNPRYSRDPNIAEK